MKKYCYLYKCRICGEEFKGVGEVLAGTALRVIDQIKYHYEEGNCNLFDSHVAVDHIGFADFIGFKAIGNEDMPYDLEE